MDIIILNEDHTLGNIIQSHFNYYDEPPLVQFTMEPSALWCNDYINEINMNNFSDEE